MSGFSLVFIIVIMAIMWFFMNRNTKKQRQQRQEQLDSMQPGAEIVTIGGLHGILSSVDATKGTIDLDCEGVILTFDRAAVKTIKNVPLTAAPVEEKKVENETFESPVEEK